jgi:hypothetical protein
MEWYIEFDILKYYCSQIVVHGNSENNTYKNHAFVPLYLFRVRAGKSLYDT